MIEFQFTIMILAGILTPKSSKLRTEPVCEVFKELLFWPEPDQKKKRKQKEKIPSVITSPLWIKHEQEKLQAKREIIEKQKIAKIAREQKKTEMEILKKVKQEQQEKKRRHKQELADQLARQKLQKKASKLPKHGAKLQENEVQKQAQGHPVTES